MIRVLLCGSIPPEWGGASGGGVATFHRTLIEELLRRGHEYGVEIAGLIPLNLDGTSSRRPPVPDVFLPPPQAASADFEMEFYARTLQQARADVVIFQHIAHRWAVHHSQLRPPARALGVVHSWHSVTLRSGDDASRVRRIIDKALAACDRLVFVSEETRAEGERLGFDYLSEPIVINNPLGAIYLGELAVGSSGRRGWIFVGSLVERKNPVRALEAAARCGAHLTIVGEGPQEELLRTTAARLGMQNHVVFVGWAPPERVRDLLLCAELLCNPSLSEGFSIAYLEAIACGVPVVGAAANVAELGERLGLACGAAITQGTVDEIAARAQWVGAFPWDRPELRRRALAAFAPSTAASAYASILHDMMRGTGNRRSSPPART